MVRYETLLLANPSITQDEVKSIETSLTKVVQSKDASIISFEKWGKYRLAYSVQGSNGMNDYGVYILVRFEAKVASGNLPKEITNLCKVKLSKDIMREMTIRMDKNSSLHYQKPPSLEDTPSTAGAGNVESFLRKSNMEGLISSANEDSQAEVDTKKDDNKDQGDAVADKAVEEESND